MLRGMNAKSADPFVDVIVAGAGLNGLAAALLLADAGARTLVADRATEAALAAPAYDGRTTAVAQGAMRMLARVGAWDATWADGAITDIRIIDGDSPLTLHYHGPELNEGDLGCIVPNAALRQRLFAAATAHPRVTLRLGAAIDEVERTLARVDVRFADGGAAAGALLAAADGRGSPMRKAAGIGERAHDYGQISIVANVAHERPHRGVAHERFLPAGPFAILPLPDAPDAADAPWPHRSSIVWTDGRAMAERCLGLDRAAFDAELARRFGDQFGAVRTVGDIASYPLKLVVADRMIDRRLALVGDAARAIHPIAGQGFNLGIRDSAELARQIGDRLSLGLDPGGPEGLERYAALRMTDAASLIAATHGVNALFSTSAAPVGHLRRLGLAAVQATPPLKRRFMRHAMGLNGRAALLAGDKPPSL